MKGKKLSLCIRERGKKVLNLLLCMVLMITLIPAVGTEVAEAATAYTTLSTYNGSGFHWNYTYQNDSETGTFNLRGNYDGNGFKFEKETIMNVSGTNTITVTSANQMGNELSGNAMGIYAPAGLTIGGDGTLNINITITNPTGTNEKSGIIGLYAKEMTIGENVTVNINIKTSGEKNEVTGVELSNYDGFTIQDNAHLNISIDNGTEGDAYGIYTRSALNLNGNSVTTVEMQNNAVAGIYNGSISKYESGKINISGGVVHVTLPTIEDSAITSYGIATNIRTVEDASISLSDGADVTVTGGRYGVFTKYQTGSGLDSYIDVQDSELTVTDAYCGIYSNGTKFLFKNSKVTVNSKDTAVLASGIPLNITGNSVIQWSGKSNAVQQNYWCTESVHAGPVNSIDLAEGGSVTLISQSTDNKLSYVALAEDTGITVGSQFNDDAHTHGSNANAKLCDFASQEDGTYQLKFEYLTRSISLSQSDLHTFPEVTEGYGAQTEKEITVTNTGTGLTGDLTVELSGTNADDFTLSKNSISSIAVSGYDTFSVVPNTGLTTGTYTATVTVSGSGITPQSFEVSFTVNDGLTAIDVPSAVTGLIYNGTAQTGVNAGTGYTISGTSEATNFGSYNAIVSLTAGYKWSGTASGDQTINWSIAKKAPEAGDFTFAPPANLIYDENAKSVSLTLKAPFSGIGTITPKYYKDSTLVSEAKAAGTYIVKFDIAEGTNFTSASDFSDASYTFTIMNANQEAPAGLGVAQPLTSSGKGKITGTTNDMEYQKVGTSSWTDCANENTEVDPGTYIVRYKAKTNYNAGSPSAELVVDPFTATVSITADVNMTKTEDSGNAEQNVTSAISPVVYMANEGYYFPEDYAVDGQNGITVTRNSYAQITVSGTPTADVNMILIAPTAKTQELQPSVIFTATGTDEGKLTNVSSGMKYQIDSGDWNDITSSSDIELRNLSACTISVVKKGGNITTDSPVQKISIRKATKPTGLTVNQPSTIGGKGSIITTDVHEYSTDGINYNSCTGALNGLDAGTYYIRVKAKGTELASENESYLITAFTGTKESTPNASFKAIGNTSGTLTNVTSAMKYSVDGGINWISITGTSMNIDNVTVANGVKVMQPGDGNTTIDSDAQVITVTKASAPTTVIGTACTNISNNNGKLQNVTSEMEYQKSGESAWIDCSGSEVTDLKNGTYFVRVKANRTVLASDYQTIQIEAYVMPVLTGTVSIQGITKYGQSLTASVADDNSTSDKYTYTWKRAGMTLGMRQTYTLSEADINQIITCEVSADDCSGVISKDTAKILKADSATPAPFTLEYSLNADGETFTATILTVTGGEYSFDGINYSAANTKADCLPNTEYTGYVRIQETGTHCASGVTSDTQISPKLTVATPVINPAGGSFTSGKTVSISCTTAGAAIHYTTDGTEPTILSTQYAAPFILTSSKTIKAIAVKPGMNNSGIATGIFVITTASSGGDGGFIPTIQKPTIEAGEGVKVDLSADGTKATITVEDGYDLADVVLNGVSKGKETEVTGLKTGDKLVVTAEKQKTAGSTKEDILAQLKNQRLAARSKVVAMKNGKKAVKITWINKNGVLMDFDGVEIYRSTKRYRGYGKAPFFVTEKDAYYNTSVKAGIRYYYKVRGFVVIDGEKYYTEFSTKAWRTLK